MLSEAAAIAAGAGDATRAMAAADALTKAFVVRILPLKQSLLQAASRAPGPRTAERAKALGVADDAVQAGDFGAAAAAAGVADSAAAGAGDARFRKSVAARTVEVKRLRGEFLRLAPAIDKLRESPGDAASNV